MITPEELRRKAENLYPAFLDAWLRGEPFFPKSVPCDKRIDPDIARARESLARLRQASREEAGWGYTIEWRERASRIHGRNRFPERITFETEQDYLRFLCQEREFAAFASAVEKLRARFPGLEGWIRSHRKLLSEVAAEVDGLLEVAGYLLEHPRPQVFARELPLRVDTKFIERHRQVLREWLDIVLPPHAIRSDEQHFDRRFGLRYVEPHVLVRFLDAAAQRASGSLWAECSLPLYALAALPVESCRVLIVENKVNLLTLPAMVGTIALGGLGNGVVDLRYVPWLPGCEVVYWGDIDVEGFSILSRVRTFLPGARSLMMDESTLHELQATIASSGTGATPTLPPNLTASEAAAFVRCAAENLRVEQERILQGFVLSRLQAEGVIERARHTAS